MEDVHHFEIDVALAGFGTTIMMDGKPLCGVRSVTVQSSVDQVSKITLEIIGTAKLTGEGAVYVLDRTHEMSDLTAAAEGRAVVAEDRAAAAEIRADAAEAAAHPAPVFPVRDEAP